MEPIDLELRERKTRLRKLAIELQKLEEARPRGRTKERRQHDLEIAQRRYKIDAVKFGIRELEEIIAEGRRRKEGGAARPTPPDTSLRRVLTDAERKQIATRYRRQVLARIRQQKPDFDETVTVHVERVTDLSGQPICRVQIGPGDGG